MSSQPTGPVPAVVGIGADGWDGLGEAARERIGKASVLLGAPRQLDLVPPSAAERRSWPSPLLPALPGLLAEYAGCELVILASGDPMFFGIGTTVAAHGPVEVLPHVSSFALACARLGWAGETTDVISAVGRDLDAVRRLLQPGRRFVLLSEGAATPSKLAGLLVGAGYGASRLIVLERLGAPDERRVEGTASDWTHEGAALNVVGVEVVPEGVPLLLPTVPGLPDAAFETDGTMTKWEIRAATLARLAPVPGQLLWDVGAGSGSIAIEWLRVDPRCRAVAVETREDRVAMIGRNAAALGVPGLDVVTGAAPEALVRLEAPDAVFVGGGATVPGVIETCWDALGVGGRLVINAVTLESERVVTDAAASLGGTLVRLSVSRAAPVGGFTAWRPALPVVQWSVVKGAS